MAEQLGWFSVSKLLRIKELLEAMLLRSCGPLDEMLFSTEYGSASGGLRMRSQTSVATSGESEAIT